jgi:hypothetical protein
MRQTLGMRLWHPVAEKEPGWDFDYEGLHDSNLEAKAEI